MRLLLFLLLLGVIYFAVSNYRIGVFDAMPRVGERDMGEYDRGEGPAENAGRAVDRALNKAGAAVEQLGERLQRETDPAPVPTTPPRG